MRFLQNLSLALGLALVPAGANAAIIGTCTIVVQNPGTLDHNPGINILSSTQGAGAPALVQVKPNSLVCVVLSLLDCYSISSHAPTSFVVAPGTGGVNVGFATSFRLNGGMNHPGNTPVKVPNGTYNMEIDLTATKNSGVFSAGQYRAEVVVRCE